MVVSMTDRFAIRLLDIKENKKFKESEACYNLKEFVSSIKQKFGLKYGF